MFALLSNARSRFGRPPEHRIKIIVAAETLNEAAVESGRAALKEDALFDETGLLPDVDVAVCDLPVVHNVPFTVVMDWLHGGAASPK